MRLGSQSCPNSNCIQEPAEVILQKQQETVGILALWNFLRVKLVWFPV